ncbi:hypothetical protein [Streptococcus cuniculipharyngis]|uniref:Uncharacterized protein n=1 Tax=Streptococcus cuniculipharyngis TaxID=1562651 RepID=A0A5C5SFW8_9STRE|nr:hypothetical protein [Streptococcus cuniculipharyngis]TWS99170.1 hypothetical protein FRX57_02950 [Streptococcus cuniculipharyngis]
MAKKKVTEIRDDIFFYKLLDVSKNAVFIGWANVQRREYQKFLKDHLPHLRELSTIENAGFESTGINVALYVFSEEVSDTYISRVYDGDQIVYEEIFQKDDGDVEIARKPIPMEDLRPKVSDLFKTVCDYKEWEAKTRLNQRLEAIKAWERGEGPNPWGEIKEERIDWENGGNAALSDLSFRNYLKSVNHDLMIFGQCGDISILETLSENLAILAELGQKVKIQLEVLRTFEHARSQLSSDET